LFRRQGAHRQLKTARLFFQRDPAYFRINFALPHDKSASLSTAFAVMAARRLNSAQDPT
jgi:hypothetical protein